MEAHDRTRKLAASPPLFANGFLNSFTRVHPTVPALLYVPLVVAMEWLGADRGYNVWQLLLFSVVGLGMWTFVEYFLHRLVFHWEPDYALGRRLHFMIHGVHHDHPNDKMRLVMPPAASIPMGILTYLLFWAVCGIPLTFPIFGGFLVGYLIYDYTHYYLHHFVPKSKRAKRLREHHMRHHFQDHRFGYGVSSPIWDAFFRTLPGKRTNDR